MALLPKPIQHLVSLLLAVVEAPSHRATGRLAPTNHDLHPTDTMPCGTTVTLGPDDYFGTRQTVLYGITEWRASYGRRSAVETANSNLKRHHGNLMRGSTRVLGTNCTDSLLAFIIAATNASTLQLPLRLRHRQPATRG